MKDGKFLSEALRYDEIVAPKKWTSFKKWIENGSNYNIEKKKIKGIEYYIITKN